MIKIHHWLFLYSNRLLLYNQLLFKLKSFNVHNLCYNFLFYMDQERTCDMKISKNQIVCFKPKLLGVQCGGRSYTSNSKDLIISTEESELSEKLLKWAIKFRLTHLCFSQLLKILSESGLQNIPTNSAALMKAKEDEMKVYEMPPGVYVHYTIEKNLKKIITVLEEKQKLKQKDINVSVFIDNLPLNKSSNEGIWVILGSLGMKETIFFIGAFFGGFRPYDSNLFLSKFVKEAKTLCSEGLLVNNSTYNINIKRIICDFPAKAFVLNFKYFSGYSSCTKCTTKGEYLKNKVCFPEKSEARTDKDFELNFLSQNQKTVLLEIPNFSIIYNMPIDYFHIVCFSVLKKLIMIWLDNEEKYWISKSDITNKFNTINTSKPIELKTKHKILSFYKNWDMFQCREFFHYFMPFVLERSLHNHYYEHFLLLYSACRIFSTKVSEYNISLGKAMLNKFVEMFKVLYGKENVSYSVHNLLHLADDYKLHGPLDDFSSYEFEKYLEKLKNKITTRKKNFSKTILHYSQEFLLSNGMKRFYANQPKTKKKFKNLDNFLVKTFNVSCEFKELHIKNKKIIPNNPHDKYVILKNAKIIQVIHIVKIKKTNCIVGKEFLTSQNFWYTPIKSSQLNIFKVSSLSEQMNVWNIDEISQKCVKLPLNSKEFLIIPILELN